MVRVAINPLQWFELAPDGVELVARCSQAEVFRALRAAGFDCVCGDPAPGQDGPAFRQALVDADLAPAPGYFSARLADLEDRNAVLARAREFAAVQRALGLDAACLADDLNSERTSVPPANHEKLPPETLQRVVSAISEVGVIWAEFGVRACVHNHVGSNIETEEEIQYVLAETDPGLVSFCPDTGHMGWADVDPAKLVAQHIDRIRIVHLKDVSTRVRAEGSAKHWDYGAFVKAGIWQEPGRGGLDLRGVMKILLGRDCWVIAEIDHSELEPTLSAKICAEWIAAAVRGGGDD
jgi:inosose dehydratase